MNLIYFCENSTILKRRFYAIFLLFANVYNVTYCLQCSKLVTKQNICKEGLTMQLHEKLKALRIRNHFTQQEIADRLGVTRSTVSNFEIGRRKPEVDVLEKLAAIYGVDLNYFATQPICANDLIELVERAENVFSNPDITEEKKDKVYTDLMKIYLAMKEGVHVD